uniref:dimethyladenosine transferase 2, mitochondrial isoform X1 n=2 Tax=Vespula vulgaris TaxID=7454 RepID=UPI002140CEC0|nr:dimethyladenosine transferase 2, mitochondrial isoform X1 [Vespula vulgaris]
MTRVNFMISLITHTEKNKSCYLKLFSMHRKFYLTMNFLHPRNINMKKTKQKNDKKEIDDNNVLSTMIRNGNLNNLNIKDYLSIINPQYNEICPKKYLRKVDKTDLSYLVTEKDGKNFVNLIIDDLSKNMTFVAEANPGTGELTKNLLKAGIRNVYVYEPNECFLPVLYKLQDKYPNRFEIRNGNIFQMSKLYFMDLQDNKQRINEILKDVPYTSWEDKSCMQVIGTMTDNLFLKHLIWSVVFRTSFMSRGRTSFYLAIKPSVWNTLNYPQNKARMHFFYIMYQTLFDCKDLGNVERLSYIPWPKPSLKRNSKINDNTFLNVVKIEPKPYLLNNELKPNQIISYWYFVKYHLKSTSQRVIPELEKWIPGCGIRLIEKNYNIFTRFVDLTPLEFLKLYKDFTSWPEYESSLFLSSAYSYIQIVNRNVGSDDVLNLKNENISNK